MEKIEIWNHQLKPTGILKDRNLIHRDGDIHAVVRIHILRMHENQIQMLLQKRSLTCEAFPGFYDIACAGHIHDGQPAVLTAIRELEEELGIVASGEDLHFVGNDYKDWSRGSYLDKEYSFLYMYIKPITSITLQTEEVECVEWVNVEELIEKLDDSLTTYCILKEEVELVLKAYLLFMKL